MMQMKYTSETYALSSSKDSNEEIRINQPVVNAFVLFVPWMIYKSNDDYQKVNDWKLASYTLFWKLLISSNYQMRETFLNSIINQISYPNPITFYFTHLIFYIFSPQHTDDAEPLQEQIIKIFIERLVTARPHPWGIMYTFIELIKEKGAFKKKSFLKNTEFEEIIKFVFKAMKKGDITEE
jgi:CCR4-NOT transcription complex subunit 1